MKHYITKTKSGHYTLTVKESGQVFKFIYLNSRETARELLPLAVKNLGKPVNEIEHTGYQYSLI